MGLPRAFVGFSSTDINYYRMMLAWKASEHIDFNFADVQLDKAINSEDEGYIKRLCRERIEMASRFIMLIGEDTKSKHKYVRWELEVAIEKDCTIIGVNIDKSRDMVDAKTPPIMKNIGAIFVPFNAKIIAYAIENFQMSGQKDNRVYKPEIYKQLGL